MRAAIGSVLLMFALATSASGESAWVLWTQDVATDPDLVTKNKTAWRRIAAFEGKSACFADASTRAEELAGMLRASERIVMER
jgi:GT2 family glycosyltransferase